MPQTSFGWMLSTALAGTLAMAPLAGAQKADRAEVLLEAAAKKEMVDGDLKGAIDTYRKVAQSGNRAAVARALARMGQCYEKLGDTEARQAYERILREFGDQQEAVATARARLAALGGSSAQPAVVARRIWSAREADATGTVSADGRLLSLTHWDTGDLAVRDLEAGQTRLLTNKGPWDKNWEFADKSAISPDGTQIAFQWCAKGPDGCASELHVVNVDGSGRRRVFAAPGRKPWMEPHAWMPDGKRILVDTISRGPAWTRRIALLSIADGSVQVLKELPPSQARDNLILSRDGTWIAYSYPGAPGSARKDVFVIPATGGAETAVVTSPSDDRPLAWILDGKGLLFASDRGG